jgi:hypothetical protein
MSSLRPRSIYWMFFHIAWVSTRHFHSYKRSPIDESHFKRVAYEETLTHFHKRASFIGRIAAPVMSTSSFGRLVSLCNSNNMSISFKWSKLTDALGGRVLHLGSKMKRMLGYSSVASRHRHVQEHHSQGVSRGCRNHMRWRVLCLIVRTSSIICWRLLSKAFHWVRFLNCVPSPPPPAPPPPRPDPVPPLPLLGWRCCYCYCYC